jgi:hypothetical protein
MLCDFYPINVSAGSDWFALEIIPLFCVITFISDELVEVIKSVFVYNTI